VTKMEKAKWEYLDEKKSEGHPFWYKDVLNLTVFCVEEGKDKFHIYLSCNGNEVDHKVLSVGLEVEKESPSSSRQFFVFKGSLKDAKRTADDVLLSYLRLCMKMVTGEKD
jgi:hypothetical protein